MYITKLPIDEYFAWNSRRRESVRLLAYFKRRQMFRRGPSKKLDPERDPRPRGRHDTTPRETDGRCAAFV